MINWSAINTEVVLTVIISTIGLVFMVIRYKLMNKLEGGVKKTETTSTGKVTRIYVSGQGNTLGIKPGPIHVDNIDVSGQGNVRKMYVPIGNEIHVKMSGQGNDIVFRKYFEGYVSKQSISGQGNEIHYK